MLTKWQYRRPDKFTDYLTAPSRYDLSGVLLGMYNHCWNYQQVAEAVASRYASAGRYLRAEMITSQLIAHRRGRMLNNFEHWNTQSSLAFTKAVHEGIPLSGSTFTVFHWDDDRRRFVPSGPTRPIPDRAV